MPELQRDWIDRTVVTRHRRDGDCAGAHRVGQQLDRTPSSISLSRVPTVASCRSPGRGREQECRRVDDGDMWKSTMLAKFSKMIGIKVRMTEHLVGH